VIREKNKGVHSMMYAEVKRQITSVKGVSVARCSREIGINQTDLCNALNGKIPMYPKYKQLLSEYLGIDEEVLFPDEEKGVGVND
jgi:lambda repressor-like predicted transcriptional regulator